MPLFLFELLSDVTGYKVTKLICNHASLINAFQLRLQSYKLQAN